MKKVFLKSLVVVIVLLSISNTSINAQSVYVNEDESYENTYTLAGNSTMIYSNKFGIAPGLEDQIITGITVRITGNFSGEINNFRLHHYGESGSYSIENINSWQIGNEFYLPLMDNWELTTDSLKDMCFYGLYQYYHDGDNIEFEVTQVHSSGIINNIPIGIENTTLLVEPRPSSFRLNSSNDQPEVDEWIDLTITCQNYNEVIIDDYIGNAGIVVLKKYDNCWITTDSYEQIETYCEFTEEDLGVIELNNHVRFTSEGIYKIEVNSLYSEETLVGSEWFFVDQSTGKNIIEPEPHTDISIYPTILSSGDPINIISPNSEGIVNVRTLEGKVILNQKVNGTCQLLIPQRGTYVITYDSEKDYKSQKIVIQ